MKIQKSVAGSSLTIALIGRLDTLTAPRLEDELRRSLPGVTKLTFDFFDLEYLSSAGLRTLLAAQKQMNKQGSMRVRNVTPAVLDVLEITGFTDILTLE